MLDSFIISLGHKLAIASGDVLRKHFRTSAPVEYKIDMSPVTRADREAEMAMRKILEAQLPDHGIIGEEYGNVREQSPWQWVLDPIDGTRSFIAGYPIFTTLIALCMDGVPVLGIIDQPITGERWIGQQGEATTCSGKAVTTRKTNALSAATIATTSMDYFKPNEAELFDNLKRKCGNTVLGGDAYAYAGLASGRVDIVVDAGMKTYDFCALRPVIEGADGIITDWEGKTLTLSTNGRVLAAANAELHQQALKILQPSVI